jgi:hypothetical protein
VFLVWIGIIEDPKMLFRYFHIKKSWKIGFEYTTNYTLIFLTVKGEKKYYYRRHVIYLVRATHHPIYLKKKHFAHSFKKHFLGQVHRFILLSSSIFSLLKWPFNFFFLIVILIIILWIIIHVFDIKKFLKILFIQ